MIDEALAGFLQEGLGIHLGTRDQRLAPNGARALAARVETGGAELAVYLARVAARRLLPDLEANGQAAVVFARPRDDRACQVKGTFLGVRRVRESERAAVTAQWHGFLTNLETIGIPRATLQQWATWPLVAVRLRVTAVFEQTPGPAAGTQLR